MNDIELNESLNQWKVPPVPTSLRENARAGFSKLVGNKKTRGYLVRWLAAFPPVSKKTAFAGTALGASAFLLLLVTQAFPQALRMASPLIRIPYTVDSEFVEYSEKGPPKVVMYLTSYSDKGNEISLTSSLPGDSFGTAVRRTLDVVGFFFYKLAGRPAAGNPDFIRAGCVNGPVVQRGTILGFSTTIVERIIGEHRKMTEWMAPDLSCFALKIRIEEQRADGTYRVVSEKHALKVTVNH